MKLFLSSCVANPRGLYGSSLTEDYSRKPETMAAKHNALGNSGPEGASATHQQLILSRVAILSQGNALANAFLSLLDL